MNKTTFKFYNKNTYIRFVNFIVCKLYFKKEIIKKILTNSFVFIFYKIISPESFKILSKCISIPTYTDFIVLYNIKSLLEDILKENIGFTVYKDFESCFKTLRQWSGVTWCCKSFISSFFKQIDFFLLGQILFKNFNDILIVNLYFRFLAVGYFFEKSILLFYDFLGKYNSLGFLLINLYLYQVDLYMNNWVSNDLFLLKHFTGEWKNYSSIFYLRFGFLLLICITTFFKVIIFLRNSFFYFLYSHLNLRIQKKYIKFYYLPLQAFSFCGIIIQGFMDNKTHLIFICPIKRLIINLKYLGFIKNFNSKIVPCAQRRWLSLNLQEIFWKYYLLKKQLFRFYFFVNNFNQLFRLIYYLKMSLVFTIGRKLQITKLAVEKKYKYNLWKWMS